VGGREKERGIGGKREKVEMSFVFPPCASPRPALLEKRGETAKKIVRFFYLSSGFQTARSRMYTRCSLSSRPSLQEARKRATREVRATRREREERGGGREEEGEDWGGKDGGGEAAAAKRAPKSGGGGGSPEGSKSQAAAASEPAAAAVVTAQSRRLAASRGTVFLIGRADSFFFGSGENEMKMQCLAAEIEREGKNRGGAPFFVSPFAFSNSRDPTANAPSHELKKSLGGMTRHGRRRTEDAERASERVWKKTKLCPLSRVSLAEEREK